MEQFRRLGAKFADRIDLRRWGALAVLALGSCAVWITLTASGQFQSAPSYASSFGSSASQDLASISIDESDTRRKVYPYSVIPGGIQKAADLRNSVARDPVVAKHYEDFDVEKARVIRLTKVRALYVSYRLGNKIFWTKRPLMLAKGEPVITDGAHIARARCGNRVSELPAGPVLAAQPEFDTGPPEVAQAIGEVSALPGGPGPPIEVPLVPSPGSGVTTPGGPGGPGGGGGIIVPPIIPVTPGSGTPPVTTPEPQLLLMLCTGLAGVWWGRKKLKP